MAVGAARASAAAASCVCSASRNLNSACCFFVQGTTQPAPAATATPVTTGQTPKKASGAECSVQWVGVDITPVAGPGTANIHQQPTKKGAGNKEERAKQGHMGGDGTNEGYATHRSSQWLPVLKVEMAVSGPPWTCRLVDSGLQCIP
jgi:hypothetical protein